MKHFERPTLEQVVPPGNRRAGCSSLLRSVNELQRKMAQRGPGLVEVGMYGNGRIKPISVNAKNDDSLTISNLFKYATDCSSTNNLKKKGSPSHNTYSKLSTLTNDM